MFKKRLFFVAATLSILGAIIVPDSVNGETLHDNETDIIEIQSTTYARTIVRKYPKSVYESGNLPKSIKYEEIIVRQYYSGTLQLREFYIDRDGMVVATYTGRIYPSTSPGTPLQTKLILEAE